VAGAAPTFCCFLGGGANPWLSAAAASRCRLMRTFFLSFCTSAHAVSTARQHPLTCAKDSRCGCAHLLLVLQLRILFTAHLLVGNVAGLLADGRHGGAGQPVLTCSGPKKTEQNFASQRSSGGFVRQPKQAALEWW